MEDFLFFPFIRAPSNYVKSKWLLAPERNEMNLTTCLERSVYALYTHFERRLDAPLCIAQH